MAVYQNEAHFLFSNAAKIRSIARKAPREIGEELLDMARTLEARATEIEGRAPPPPKERK
jgi:hypothetical protein